MLTETAAKKYFGNEDPMGKLMSMNQKTPLKVTGIAKNVPANSIFEISGIPKAELFALYNAGYKTIADIPKNNSLSANVNLHIQSFNSNKAKEEEDEF